MLLRSVPLMLEQIPELQVVIAGADRPWSRSLYARVARKLLPLVGTGTERQRFERLLDEHKLRSVVHLLAFRPDPERLMAAADVVAVPFTIPHFAMPIPEAGAMCKPVVASRLPGLKEAVDDERSGFLVPPSNPRALATALVRILSDDTLAREMGNYGYALSSASYMAEANAQAIIRLYDRLVRRK